MYSYLAVFRPPPSSTLYWPQIGPIEVRGLFEKRVFFAFVIEKRVFSSFWENGFFWKEGLFTHNALARAYRATRLSGLTPFRSLRATNRKSYSLKRYPLALKHI